MKTKGIFFKDVKNSHIPEILQELYIDQVYNQYLGGKKDLTILDIGANVGLFSLYASDFAKKVYAVEPAAEHTDVIANMLEFNEIDNVEIVQVAIAPKNGDMQFFHSSNKTMYSLSKLVNDNGEVENVKAWTIDKLFDELKLDHVDFLKLDIEGAEVDVVCSAGFEKIAPKIDAMVVEWHTWSGSNPSQLVNALKDYGFEVVTIPSDATIFGAVRK